MRHAHHSPGSPAGQAALLDLAGWTTSRRSFLVGSAALVSTSALPIAASGAPVGVSPRMAHLVAEVMRLNAVVFNLDAKPDTEHWIDSADDAADAAADAMTALVNEEPATLMDLAAKLNAIAEAMPDDCGTYILRRVADDATLLVGRAAR